jgi:hypothetical protein
VIELTMLTGGGAIADFRLTAGSPDQRHNVLWEAPWPGIDPDRYQTRSHNPTYGPQFVGNFLAAFTGHALCLDCFGAPSEAEIEQGLCLHGEAPVSHWKVRQQSQSKTSASLLMEAKLPHAGLTFHRELRMQRDETVVHVSETVFNLRSVDHYFHWTQHVTLGPPFLQAGESTVQIPALRAITWPHGYEGKSLLADSKEFSWPNAPAENGGAVDISSPFQRPGTGFVAAALLKPDRDLTFVAALNFRLGLVLAYCFPRKAFPWVATWEENCARQSSPWKGKTQARGVEFGTTPMPIGKREAFANGPLFGTPTFQCVPAMGKLNVTYAIFLAPVNLAWRQVLDIEVGKQAITVVGATAAGSHERIDVPARNLKIAMTGAS